MGTFNHTISLYPYKNIKFLKRFPNRHNNGHPLRNCQFTKTGKTKKISKSKKSKYSGLKMNGEKNKIKNLLVKFNIFSSDRMRRDSTTTTMTTITILDPETIRTR